MRRARIRQLTATLPKRRDKVESLAGCASTVAGQADYMGEMARAS